MKPRRPAACLLATSLLLTGCGVGGFSGLYNAPLPGGAELGDEPYRVTAHFADVLDLVPQASVKVNDVAVGRIERIGLSPDNTTAVVTMAVNHEVRLPANADARLRQSSLLGEKFVELGEPAGQPPRGRLAGGAVIPLERTNRNPQVEEVLGALSLLLNGGGVGQIQSIVQELNRALSGNEPQIRSLLSNLDDMVGRLDGQKEQITRAIDGMNRLSGALRSQTGNIENALENLGPGIRTIEEQRNQLVTMLQQLDRLSGVAVHTVDRSKEDLIADLQALEPTLRKLAETGEVLPKAIGYLGTYPFPEYAMRPLKGDFVNVDVKFDMDLSVVLENLYRSSGPLIPIAGVNDAGQSALPPLPVPPAPARPPTPPRGGQTGGLLDGLLGGP